MGRRYALLLAIIAALCWPSPSRAQSTVGSDEAGGAAQVDGADPDDAAEPGRDAAQEPAPTDDEDTPAATPEDSEPADGEPSGEAPADATSTEASAAGHTPTWEERQAAMANWVDPPRPDPASLTGPLDEERYRRPDGTVPFWTENLDRAWFSALSAELAGSPGHGDTPLVNTELRVLEFAMPLSRDYRDHDQLVSVWATMATWETLDLLGSRGEQSIIDALAVGVRLDAPWWGAGLGVRLLALREPEVLRFLMPEALLRIGTVEGPKLTASARFSGAFAFGTGDAARVLDRNYDLRAQAEWPIDDVFTAQLRGRLRDYTDDEHAVYNQIRQHELYVTAGVEVALPFIGRGLPTFLGIGIRDVLHSREGFVQNGEVGTRVLEPAGIQALVVLRTELGFHFGGSGLW